VTGPGSVAPGSSVRRSSARAWLNRWFARSAGEPPRAAEGRQVSAPDVGRS
jgi:hypothetical protein